MKKKFLGFLMATLIGVGALFPAPTFAASCGELNSNTSSIIGLKSWYYYLDCTDKKNIAESNFQGDALVPSVWKIALTVLSDLFFVAGLLAVVYVAYSGIMYILSNGDPGAVAKAKKSLTSTVVGLVIVLLAHVLVNTILGLIV